MPVRVYINKLSDSVREKDMERFFRDYGRISDIFLKNGCGFVEFQYERDADYAVYDLDGKDLFGERVKLDHARGTFRQAITISSLPRPSWFDKHIPPVRTGYRLTVQNLSSRDLKDSMRQAGEVMYVDPHKERKNEGVVEFATCDDMKNVLVKLENLEIHGCKIKLVEEKPKGRCSSSRSRSRSRRSRSRSARQSHRRSRSRSHHKSRSHSHKSRSRFARRSRSRSPHDSAHHRSTHDSPHASRHYSPHASPHDGAHRSTHKSASRFPRKSQESQSLASSKSEWRIHEERSQPLA